MIPGTVQRTVPRRRQCLSPGGGLHEDGDGEREEDAESDAENEEEGCHHSRRPLVLGLLYATESMCTALAGNGDNDSKHVTTTQLFDHYPSSENVVYAMRKFCQLMSTTF